MTKPDADYALKLGTNRHKALYAFISEQPNKVIHRSRFFTKFHWNDNDLKVAVCQLRKILPAGETIQNVFGTGYRFIPAGEA